MWIEMICIMHQACPYGHLVVNGRPIGAATLARMVGGKAGEVTRWLEELELAGVFDREGETIVSRRMVRDEATRKARAEGGKLGGNPALKDNRKVVDKVNHVSNLQPTPSSSTSSSSSSSKESKALSGKPDGAPPNGRNYTAEARDVLDYLNRATGKGYRHVDSNLVPIVARLKSGVSVTKIREVIFAKCEEWGKNDEMRKFLRPETLFRASKFEQYLGEINGVS